MSTEVFDVEAYIDRAYILRCKECDFNDCCLNKSNCEVNQVRETIVRQIKRSRGEKPKISQDMSGKFFYKCPNCGVEREIAAADFEHITRYDNFCPTCGKALIWFDSVEEDLKARIHDWGQLTQEEMKQNEACLKR